MSKTYKHQLEYDLRNGRKDWHYYYAVFSVSNSGRKIWGRVFWRKLRHQWKEYLKNPKGSEPHNKPENFDWIID